jgi:uncharacterized protein (TIGR00297 family)
VAQEELNWQSKLVLLVVLPFTAVHVFLGCHEWASESVAVAIWATGLGALLGLITWWVRAATPAGALTGALITASLMFSTVAFPYQPWHTALTPVLAVAFLAFLATHVGRAKKESLGTAEKRKGRSASQVAATLGFAGLVSTGPAQFWLMDAPWLDRAAHARAPLLALALAALAEAAADTVSSEIGQVLGGKPRMITTFRVVQPGRNGAISAAGTLAGLIAAGVVASFGMWALRGDWNLFTVSAAGGVFGLLFDSLLGATLEDWGWLNNDAVNFLSTAGAAGFALLLLEFVPFPMVG